MQCLHSGLGRPVAEHRFAAPRRWRFDWAWPEEKIAVEIEGGVFTNAGSRHTRGAGFRADLEKYNAATVLGWRVLRFLPEHVSDGTALTTIERLLKS